jgi:16S rRNA (adenine1518-N6/adenine1519-N6)-dimethyltransferase
VRPSKALGQHFLIDPNLARAIVRDAGVGPGDRVLEIGAGLGALTVPLAETGADPVVALELDPRLLPPLREVSAAFPTVRVLPGDATALGWADVMDGQAPSVVIGNLPYNAGTTITLDALQRGAAGRIVVMLQREVGERLIAGPGDEAFGAVSLRVAYRAEARLMRTVPPEVFWPRPSVASVVVRLDRLSRPPVATDEVALWRVVETAFAERRKTMRNAVRRLGVDATTADSILGRASVDPAARPEQLDLPAFARIAEALSA